MAPARLTGDLTAHLCFCFVLVCTVRVVLMCACYCVGCACTSVYVEARGTSSEDTSSVFFDCSLPYFLRPGLSLNQEFDCRLGCLGIKLQGSSCLHFLNTHHICILPCHTFCMDAGNLNSGPQACMATPLPTRPTPQLLLLLFFRAEDQT